MNGKLLLLAGAVGLAGGLGAGWGLWHPRAAPAESPAASQRQRDSSLVLRRAPDAAAKPAQLIPKGATVERIAHVVVQPRAVPATAIVPSVPRETLQVVHGSAVARDTGAVTGSVICPPVRIDLTLIRLRDNTRRVIASSPDGTVLDSLSVDIPVSTAAPERRLLYSAGVTRDLLTSAWGAVITRDVGPLRLAVIGQPAQAGVRGEMKLGISLRW